MTPRYRTMQVEELGTRILPSVVTLALRPSELLSAPAEISSLDTAHGQSQAAGPQQFGSAAEFWKFYFDIEAAVQQYRHLLGTTSQYDYRNYWWWGCDTGVLSGSPGPVTVLASAASITNLQEQGVDEADLVKTDGEYIYLIRNGELVIVDARARRRLKVASHTDIEGSPLAQYLIGDRLTVISQWGGYYYGGQFGLGFTAGAPWVPGGYHSTVKVTVFDVSSASAPGIVEETYLDGSYSDSRAIGDNVYLVVQNYLKPLPAPRATYTQLEDGYSYTYETETEYRQRLASQAETLPGYWSVHADGTVQHSRPLSEPETIYRPESPNERSLVSVVAFDVGDQATGPTDAVTLATSNVTIYASTSHLYLIGQQYSYDWTSGDYSWSTIHKVGLHGGDVEFEAAGQVPGHILNQFSMDEENGYFRIATTSMDWRGGGGNHVYILAEQGDALNVVGAIENLAPGEMLYSARFFGARGFLVTFKKVDPLFALDLSDPTNPRVMGELKIPGYSDYLQPIDDHHLLAIGRDADDQGSFAWFQEMQVSLFDVSDLTNPILLERYSFEGGRNGSSSAGGQNGWSSIDHHAFTYIAEHDLLGIPFTVTSGRDWVDTDHDGRGDSWVFDSRPDTFELRLFSVDPVSGIDVAGSIAHDSRVLRSFLVGDRLFSLSQNLLKVHALADLDEPLAELDLRLEPGPLPEPAPEPDPERMPEPPDPEPTSMPDPVVVPLPRVDPLAVEHLALAWERLGAEPFPLFELPAHEPDDEMVALEIEAEAEMFSEIDDEAQATSEDEDVLQEADDSLPILTAPGDLIVATRLGELLKRALDVLAGHGG
jgi:hypothetical protein